MLRDAPAPRGTSIKRHSACIVLKSGCYDTRAVGSSVCREARDGACALDAEGYMVGGGRHGSHGSRVRDSMQGVERVREATCTQGSNNCQTCGATIGTDTYCSVCTGANYAPVNGACVDVSSNQFCTKDGSTGTCSACKGTSFMFKCGCYEKGKAPGNTICQTGGDTEGVCETYAERYFTST